MPSHISTAQLLKAFVGVNCSASYDMDVGWELNFWGNEPTGEWRDLQDAWREHIRGHKHFWVEVLLLQEFGAWFRETYHTAPKV